MAMQVQNATKIKKGKGKGIVIMQK